MVFFFLLLGAVLIFLGVQIYIRKRIVEETPRGSYATHPGGLKPNLFLLRDLTPGLYPHSLKWEVHKDAFRIRIFIARQLWFGASNPAVVIQESPFIVAAYAADCDAVLLLRFVPESVESAKARGIGLHVGSHVGSQLLSVNTYFLPGQERKNDEIVLGPRQTGLYSSFRPYIAEFMCKGKEMETIERKKREISPALWERTKQLGMEKIRDSNLDEVRWGNPMLVEVPRSYRRAILWAQEWDTPY